MTEREVLRNLQAIVADADKTPVDQIAATSIGMLTTENRKVWSGMRKGLLSDRNNAACLNVVDQALFVVCLDDATPESLADVCNNFLCGSYSLTPSTSTYSLIEFLVLTERSWNPDRHLHKPLVRQTADNRYCQRCRWYQL